MARDLGMSASWLLGVESGQNGIDAVRLADVGRYLGFPASYFLDDPDFVHERQRQLMSRPATRLDWLQSRSASSVRTLARVLVGGRRRVYD
jgi:transcriptional regulator with XRE-family HTH domain